MSFDKPYIQTTNAYKQPPVTISPNRTIYYGEVININDETEGGMIQVRVPDLDNRTADEDIPWSYPLLPKFFHIYPQVGEIVRIFLEDIKYPMRSRYWIGSVISQLHKIGFDSRYTATSTTNLGLVNPDPAPSTYPAAVGVFPTVDDIAIIGKVNTDVILRVNELHLRAGKHDNDNILVLNTVNPAEISLVYEPVGDSTTNYYSNTIIMSDKIALISHEGTPQFKAANLTAEDRNTIFEEGHPIARADVLVDALNIFRQAILTHVHGYSVLPADKTAIIKKLEQLQLDGIMQENVVTN